MGKSEKIKITLEDILPLLFRFLVKNKFLKTAEALQKEASFDLFK